MAMIRHRAAAKSKISTRLLYSSRTPEDVIYFDELEKLRAAGDGLEVFHTFTRTQPPNWTGYSRRIDNAMLSQVAGPWGEKAQTFICGPTLLVEAAADGLAQIGLAPERIKTERFGPSGGTA